MKNLATSILDRLRTNSRENGRTYNLVLEDFATARLIARLSASRFKDRFILKGAQLFKLWADSPHRPTRDTDFLSFGSSSPDGLTAIFREICAIETNPPDALVWAAERATQIREDNLYGGVRIKLTATLGTVRIPAQVDVGFGDSITPEARRAEWPMPLGFPVVPLQVYCPETSIAEKLHAAVVLDMANSRMKDFFDLYWLSNHQEFDFSRLGDTIHATFKRRETQVPIEIPLAYTPKFSTSPEKQVQWKAFLRKSRLEQLELGEVIERISQFLTPLFTEEAGGQTWHPESGWSQKTR